MRGQGRVYRPKVRGWEVVTWWLDYSLAGRRYREPANTKSKSEAIELLRQRIGDRKSGKVVGRPDRVTLADLRGGLERHYQREDNRSLRRAQQAFDHLERFLRFHGSGDADHEAQCGGVHRAAARRGRGAGDRVL